MMKVGDLVKVEGTCKGGNCFCWFCSHGSSNVGISIERLRTDPLGNVCKEALDRHKGYWIVNFNAGECRLYGSELTLANKG